MTVECIKEGKTVDLAIEAACIDLQKERDGVDFEILQLPRKTFLGLKMTPAKVRVFYEKPESKVELATDYIENVLKAMGLSAEIVVKQENNAFLLDIVGDDLSIIIGHRGETLDALQYLTGLVANKLGGDYVRFSVDSGNYRDKRVKTLEELAIKLANSAVKTGRSCTLEPMNPYERRVIHAAVSKIPGATSTSIDAEPNRRIIISSQNRNKTFSERSFVPNKAAADRPRSSYSKDKQVSSHRDKPSPKPAKPYSPKPYSPKPDYAPKPSLPVAEKHKAEPTNDAKSAPLYGKITLD